MSKRILLLVHQELIPPENLKEAPDRFETPWLTEYDVFQTLKKQGFDVKVLGLISQIEKLTTEIEGFKPHVVFNLLEEFNHETQSDYKVLALLDMMRIKYTGCNPKGLLIARDKALSKKILKYHKIPTPTFFTYIKGKKKKLPKNLNYPLIVKCLYEEASYGIAKASVVHTEDKLLERIAYIHDKLEQDAIIEEFIAGREIYVGVMGNKKLTTLPLWELKFENVDEPAKEIYSSQAKWNKNYRKRKGIETSVGKFPKPIEDKIIKICKKTYQVLELSGYARIDLRVTSEGKIYILEANPNPNIASDDEFASSAAHAKIKYDDLIASLIPN